MKHKASKTIILTGIGLAILMTAVSSCTRVIYDPSNRTEPVTITIKQPIK